MGMMATATTGNGLVGRQARTGGDRGRRWWSVVAAAGAVLAVIGGAWVFVMQRHSPLYEPNLSGRDRLLTNEYAHWNPGAPGSHMSLDWSVTSGSLFLRHGVAWTGVPDAKTPDAASDNGTGSSVFRMTSHRRDFGNAAIAFRLRNLGLISNGRAAASEIDGVHVLMRWQSPAEFYVVSVNRRDNLVVVKKKLPGGDVNGGTYITLGQAPSPVAYGSWQSFQVRIKTTGSTLVTISVTQRKQTVLTALDDGTHGRAILASGAVGLRGDNCQFEFASFKVLPA
jgi:hypothetical protein